MRAVRSGTAIAAAGVANGTVSGRFPGPFRIWLRPTAFL